MVEYESLRENSTSILERDQNMKECSLEANLEGEGW